VYGAIQKVVEASNTDKTKCSIQLICKDERNIKFRFTN
jgi:hypothetical protein